jgi:hypothetical protein
MIKDIENKAKQEADKKSREILGLLKPLLE